MCEAMDRISKRRAEETVIEMAIKMIAGKKLQMEDIAEYTGLSLAKVQELAESIIPAN